MNIKICHLYPQMVAESSDWCQLATEKCTLVKAFKKTGEDTPSELDSVVTEFGKNILMSFLTFHLHM